MNKKQLTILLSSIAAVVVIALVIVLIVINANGLKKYNKMIDNSAQTVLEINVDIQLKDQSELVYQHYTTTKISETNATIEETISSLGPNFVLDTTSNIQTKEGIKKEDLVGISLDKESLSNVKIKKNLITCEVSKENLSKVLKNNDIYLDMNGNAELIITFEDKKLKSIVCTYKTSTAKDVIINATYAY